MDNTKTINFLNNLTNLPNLPNNNDVMSVDFDFAMCHGCYSCCR